MTKIERQSERGTKAWENIHNKNKGMRDFPYEGQRPGNFLTHFSHRASRRNMPFKEWRNLLEVPIASQQPLTTHPPIHYFSYLPINMPSSSRQRVNAVRRAIEFNREASPLIFNQDHYEVSRLIIG